MKNIVQNLYYRYLAWRQIRYIKHLKRKYDYKNNLELNFGKNPEFEGIYRGGKYYRKLKDGSYYSADGLCYLKEK